jgi:hypothetical protein
LKCSSIVEKLIWNLKKQLWSYNEYEKINYPFASCCLVCCSLDCSANLHTSMCSRWYARVHPIHVPHHISSLCCSALCDFHFLLQYKLCMVDFRHYPSGLLVHTLECPKTQGAVTEIPRIELFVRFIFSYMVYIMDYTMYNIGINI